MFTNIMQPNMNGVGGIPFASNIQVNNVNGQSGFDTNSFMKILTAIVFGLNNAVANSQLSVAGVQSSINGNTITPDDVSKGLFVDDDELAVTGDALSGILQQMITQLSVASNQVSVANSPSSINSDVMANAVVSLMTRSEEGMQKVNIHTNTNSNANSDGNAFVQIKTITNQEPKVGMLENKTAQLPSREVESKNAVIDSKQAARPDLIENAAVSSNSNIGSDQHIKTTMSKKELDFNFSVLNKNETEHAVNTSDAKTHLVVNEKDGGMIASTSQLYNAPYVKSDLVIVAKEPIHVSRLHELGEVMEKTVRSGDKHLIINIEPPDLGSIQIKLRMDNGILRADLKVDSPVVKDLFSMAIPQIKTSLEDSGIKVSDFFVDVKEDYYSDGRRQQDDTNQHNKQNKKQENFFDYFA